MEHDATEPIRVAADILNTLYITLERPTHTTVEALRRFAQTDEERTLAPDELARRIIKRELAYLKSEKKAWAATSAG